MSTPTDVTPKPILTPLTYGDALDLAHEVIWHGSGDLMADRLARALMRVDVASREQAQPPQHDSESCQTCIVIKAKETADKISTFYDARNTGGECGD